MGILDPSRNLDPLIRSYTAAQWTAANYVLLRGELGIESDTGKMKLGAGKQWSSTSYLPPSGLSTTVDILDGSGTAYHHLTFENGILTQYTTTPNN